MNTLSTAPPQLVDYGMPVQCVQEHILTLANVHHPTFFIMADSSVFKNLSSILPVQKIITCRDENLPPTPTST